MKSDWNVARADEFCFAVTDGTHDSPKPQMSGKKLVTSKHLKGTYIDFDSANWIKEEDYQKVISRSKVEQWDILYSMIGTIGNLYIEKNADVEYACKNVGIFKFGGNRDKAYWMYYYLQSKMAKEYIHTQLRGSTQSYIPLGALREMPVIVPPQNVQTKVIQFLRAVDDKIALNNKINDNLEQQAQALYKSWFVDFEPFGNKMPYDWKSGVLGDFVEIKRGGSPRPIQEYLSDEGLRWLKISDATTISTPYILDIKEHIKESGLKKTVFLKAGDLVLSNSATPGIPKILDVDSCIHDGWLYFPNSKLSKEYLYLFFKLIRRELVSLGNGSVFTNLKTDILKNYPTILPSKDVLTGFDSAVKSIFEEILCLTRENKRLSELRDTLLPKLMSGELDVEDVKI